MNNMFDLTGKVAVVTGASSGLGRDAALSYADYGADVALLARRKDKLDELAKEITAKGRKAVAIACDVGDEESVKAASEEILKAFSKVDILLNNAGVAFRGAVHELPTEDWEKSMDINVKGIYLMSKYIVPQMKEQKYGKIVNIASINAIVADKGPDLARHAYNASKAAVRGLTMGMAATYMEDNITVNSIGPGLFESEMTADSLFKHEGFMNLYNSLTPASRPGRKGELNGTIIYLSSDASSYVTSQHIIVDGGFSIV
ncbi:short-chain dehydrogenase/reductase SDR [Listeria floridensis FSL S10-1187]|uniref:Short-chain dehydrogenase/reductase SDR n=1 Tax=Listeria floridensis FSL S10-1187 TaxID=1265817 RepID=A0ABN0REV5_9LIST|nr:SDR family NAD(P)-dependent oxidoreductase [Listeria floridensis]EUJ31660.1 short-chain dehydrogenase/reductase SDR [Listeria floridensis FSL S10-1187]